MAENNAAILALVDVYAPHAKTEDFGSEATKFRRYAIAWRDRWNSVAEVPFSKEFASAVQAEIEATARVLIASAET